jgi:Ca2+-binding EF-hand superfamily protein
VHTDEEIAKIHGFFDKFDTDHSDTIDADEVTACLCEEWMDEWMDVHG